MLLVTLTAQGDKEHYLRDGEPCRCTPLGGTSVAAFNATASKQFNRWMQDMRRTYGPIEYARAAEIQDGKRRSDGKGRGALHFHVLVRAENEGLVRRDFKKRDPFCPMRLIAMKHGFGHSIDVEDAKAGTAWYCAKYASKSAAERAVMPWFDRVTGELVVGNGRYRTWTASRGWGLTMKDVRRAQAEWARAHPLSGSEDATETDQAADGGPLDSNTLSYTTSGRSEDGEEVGEGKSRPGRPST